MENIEISQHAQDMLREREIPEEWMWQAINDPDRAGIEDDNMHYIKAIAEDGGRYLRVVVNPNMQPNRIVTLFFDRRLGRKENETEG